MVIKDLFKDIEKLTPEERVKRLKEIEEAIEHEKNEQIKAAEELIEKANHEMENESEEDKLERLFEHITEEESLEQAVKKEDAENIEGHVQYNNPVNEVEEKIEEIQGMYARNDDVMYKKGDVSTTYDKPMDAAAENWKAMGYEKTNFS